MTPAEHSEAIRAAVDGLVAALLAAVAPAPADLPDRLLSVDEAAAALSVGRSRLYGEIASGRLRSLSVGRRRLVPASAVRAFIDKADARASRPVETPDGRTVSGTTPSRPARRPRVPA